jgi:hypothetical protein
MNDKTIAFLLANANPSIQRRVKSEIMGELPAADSAHYQERIMQEPVMQQIIAHQGTDGWIGQACHGAGKPATGLFSFHENATKYLAEKAVEKETPVLRRAMEAFKSVPLEDERYQTGGKIIDEFKVAAHGMNLIRAACVARAGYAEHIGIAPQIQLSLDSFKRALEVDSVLDITRPIKNGKQRVFKDYEKWPCRYHLDILAHTQSWKNKDNIRMIADSALKLMRTDCPDLINLIPSSWIGHPLGTLGGFPAQGLSLKCNGIYPFPILKKTERTSFLNIELIEWLARCGIAPYVEPLQEAIGQIENCIDGKGACALPVSDDTFARWGPYSGMRLETDWKAPIKRECDITFRALLILHYSSANASA